MHLLCVTLMKNPFHLDAVPGPWRYNPSKWSQRIRICCVASIAVFFAIYMGLHQLGLLLLMIAIVPSQSELPIRSWQEFTKTK